MQIKSRLAAWLRVLASCAVLPVVVTCDPGTWDGVVEIVRPGWVVYEDDGWYCDDCDDDDDFGFDFWWDDDDDDD